MKTAFKKPVASFLVLTILISLVCSFLTFPAVFAADEIPGDPMVWYTQKWLNQEYGNVPGFGKVVANGKTGWDTVYGLLRALQHELGIKNLSDSFGAATTELYQKDLLYRQDGITDKKFAILQGALWCKGYNPGYYLRETSDGTVVFEEIFDASVESAIIQLKKDAGLTNPDGVVTLNVMKALLSMDTFKLLVSYGGKPEIRTMQQKLNRKYEDYIGLMPCDGIYGRNTNKALIFALQAEMGLPKEVANGSFGPATRLCCPEIPYAKVQNAARRYPGTSAEAFYTDPEISVFTEFLQFALYVNGFGSGAMDGVFNVETEQNVRDFQEFHALEISGTATLGTWWSLLTSSGDPNRPVSGADCAMKLDRAKAKTLYDHGYRIVGRYLTNVPGGRDKAITKEEAQIILDTGLRFFPIYQAGGAANAYFTEAQGASDAKTAIAAAEALGIPGGTFIYFAVDYDATDDNITTNVVPYFEKVHEIMSASVYKTGIYGTRNVCGRVAAMGYSENSFVSNMSTGFSGNLGFRMPDDWAFDQFANLEGENALGQGEGRVEIDKNAVSGRDRGVAFLTEGTLTATPTSSKVLVDGKEIAFDAYNILGNNYFKLRDLAYVLNGTPKQFEVGYDGKNDAISLIDGKPYTPVGGEMASKGKGIKTPTPTKSKIYLDGKEISPQAYNIDGNNYFKLRDIGEAFDFGVDWDGAKNTISIDTGKKYTK